MRSSTVRRLLLATAPALLLAACDGIAWPALEPDPLLRTDRDAYVLVEHQGDALSVFTAEIPFTLDNTTGETFYKESCTGSLLPVLERWDGGEWVRVWEAGDIYCYGLVTIAPEEVFQETLLVWAAEYGSNTHPQFAVPDSDIPGKYRLALRSARYGPDGETPVPDGALVSNPFQLRVE